MDREAMDSERAVIRQVTFRILPLVWIVVFFAALDRSNLSFAALQMNKDVGLGAEAFGFGAGLFFIPYALFAVPSNFMLQKGGGHVSGFRFSWSPGGWCPRRWL